MPLTQENINDITKQIKELSTSFIQKSQNLKFNTDKIARIFDNYIQIRDNIKPHMLEPSNGNNKRIDRVKVASIMAVCIVHIEPIELKETYEKSNVFDANANIYLAYHIALAILQDFSHGDILEGHQIISKNYEIIRPKDYTERFRKLILNNKQVIKDINHIDNISSLFFIIHIFYFINFMSQIKYQERYIESA